MDRRIGKKKCQLCVFQADLRLCSWLGFGGAAWELLLHSLKGTQQRTKVWGVWNDSMLNWGVAGIAKCSNIEKCMRIRCPEILETVSMVCFLYQNMLFGKKNSVAPSFNVFPLVVCFHSGRHQSLGRAAGNGTPRKTFATSNSALESLTENSNLKLSHQISLLSSGSCPKNNRKTFFYEQSLIISHPTISQQIPKGKYSKELFPQMMLRMSVASIKDHCQDIQQIAIIWLTSSGC